MSGTTGGASRSTSSAGSGDRTGPSSGDNNNSDNALPSDSSIKGARVASGSGSVLSSSDYTGSGPVSSSAVHFSSSDPVLVPSEDLRLPGGVGAIRREVGSQPVGELNVKSSGNKLTAG